MDHGIAENKTARLYTTWLGVTEFVGPHCHGYRYHARFLDYTPVGIPLQLVTDEWCQWANSCRGRKAIPAVKTAARAADAIAVAPAVSLCTHSVCGLMRSVSPSADVNVLVRSSVTARSAAV